MKSPFSRVLIANRGEIAIRIARACTELGITTIGIYSFEDRFSLHRYKTDESYKIGTQGEPIKGYLDYKAIVALAVERNIDAIHPGYGFLSENEDFARACQEANIIFVGPAVETLGMFGDKVKARTAAKKAGLNIIPGTLKPVPDVQSALAVANEFGYPVTLKSVQGGGGKGIRMVPDSESLKQNFPLAQNEALTNFGSSEIYIEKQIENPKHIEIQILGDHHGNIVHLFERDCSIQRRNQKVIEVAPALGIKQSTRETLWKQSLDLAKKVSYVGLGTVEFLVDKAENIYFLEVNPRVQVEHTVTEMITGIDLIQASLLVASNAPLSDKRIGITNQDSISCKGAAIQCRITTEDPLNSFAPDVGRLIAYRPAAGFGIRLDEGHATSGATVTPYYDSLLVKVTAWAQNIEQAGAKMNRCLTEFRIRGVKHNISLLKNVINHSLFLANNYSTSFFQQHPEVFSYKQSKDRATKLLNYIAHTTINDPHGVSPFKSQAKDSPDIEFRKNPNRSKVVTAKQIFDEQGVSGLQKWINQQKQLLLTDTTMRDAHQSLFATRLRSRDIYKVSPYYAEHTPEFFSLEVWGGATFDTSLRFLKEDPWERLQQIREKIPNILLQMLLRGDNAVGYTNYPTWVIKEFVKTTCESGLDLFRIFDCLNQADKMQTAIDSVKNNGGIAEVCICYTGNVISPKETKYTLKYYLDLVKDLEDRGADIICFKDMAGLLRPQAAKVLIDAVKQQTSLPIHLHTHDTSGAGVAMLLSAANAGCDIVDGAISSMSGLTSQPSLNALAASLQETDIAPQVSSDSLDELGRYWSVVRSMYEVFDPGLKSNTTEVYRHEIPGGQYSNLYNQASKVGLSPDEFYDLTCRYEEVNSMLGNIIKVTPSSKVVGDFALFLQKNNLTGPELLAKKPSLDFPDSVVNFFKGSIGTPKGGFPHDIKELILKQSNSSLPTTIDASDTFAQAQKELAVKLESQPNHRDVISYRLYPKVFLDYIEHKKIFGDTSVLTTPVFFYGLTNKEELEVQIESGKTLYIIIQGISDVDKKGQRSVFYKLNGFNRVVEIADESIENLSNKLLKADGNNPLHLGAPMLGKIVDIHVAIGDAVAAGDVLMVTEAMKMEYGVTAKTAGTVKAIYVQQNDMIDQGDLLIELA